MPDSEALRTRRAPDARKIGVRKLPVVLGGSGPRFVRHTGAAAPLLTDASENPELVLDQELYGDASILLADENFGSGKLPEAEVFRLMAHHIRSVIAPSFDQAFYSHCLTSGILPVNLAEESVEEITDWVVANPGVEMTVDLEEQLIEVPGIEPFSFHVDERARSKLLRGMNDLDEILEHNENVVAFREHDRSRRPWVYSLREEDTPPATPTSQDIKRDDQEA